MVLGSPERHEVTKYILQEAMESIAFPDKILFLDPIILWEIAYCTAVFILDCCKKPFLFPFNTTT